MNARSAKCNCTHCGGAIEFDVDSAGQEVACPHCGKMTWVDLPDKFNFSPAHSKARARAALEAMESIKKSKRTEECDDCGERISYRAVVCPHCGSIPSLGRVGWYVFCIMGVIGLISSLFYFLIWGAEQAMGLR